MVSYFYDVKEYKDQHYFLSFPSLSSFLRGENEKKKKTHILPSPPSVLRASFLPLSLPHNTHTPRSPTDSRSLLLKLIKKERNTHPPPHP